MKITLNKLKDAFVLEADIGEVPVWEVDYGETKLYPDTETGVKQAKFRVPERGTEDWCYFIHSWNAVNRECSPTCNIILRVAGQEYSLFGSVNGLPVAQMTQEGLVTFPDGHVPTLQELSLGAEAVLLARVPEMKSSSVGGNLAGYESGADTNMRWGKYAEKEYTPIIAGTLVHGYFTKGQKKVSTGDRVIVTEPDGNVLMDNHMQQNGHRRGYYDWTFGTIGVTREKATLKVIPHQARGLWGGYFVYPAFNRQFRLPLEGIVFRQEDDDQYNC